MPTSSLLSIARLLGLKGIRAMAAAVALPPPITARRLIDRAPSNLLAGWSLLTGQGIQIDAAANAWHAGHVEDAFPLDADRVLLASHTGGVWLAARDGSSVIPLSNGWRARRPLKWSARATSSFPVPDGPVISVGKSCMRA